LDWTHFPERDLERNWGQVTVPYAAFAAACLVKLNEGLVSMADLRRYLVEHPSFIRLCGFPVHPSPAAAWGFDAEASLPAHRHLTRMLHKISNAALQFLLADSVRLILAELRQVGIQAGDCISLDTKHIIAWVKENNPKAYVEKRYDTPCGRQTTAWRPGLPPGLQTPSQPQSQATPGPRTSTYAHLQSGSGRSGTDR
jgi:hypothetical protein